MPEAINFFQSFLGITSFSQIGASRQEIRLANLLKKEARKFEEEAELEALNADKAQNLTGEENEKSVRRSFAEIALWHHRLSSYKFRRAAARYAEAAKIQTTKQKDFDQTAKEMSERAAHSERAVTVLSNFIKQN